MDKLPQGLPRDWRRTVRYLKTDPRHGGPPASNVGFGPDGGPRRPLGLPLPNFRGLHRDGLPCHVDYDTLHRHWRNKDENPQDFTGPYGGLNAARIDMVRLQFVQRVQLFASCQPLTVQPLPDGSNIYSAEVGSIEEGFQDAFTWYKRWLEFIHYEEFGPAQFDRLSRLTATVQGWKLAQTLFPPAEPSAVNGLYPIPPPMQEFIWPWYFWNTWQIRRDLRDWPDRFQPRDFSIIMLDDCLQKEYAIDRALCADDWIEDRFFALPEALRQMDDQNVARAVSKDLDTCLDAQREYFKTRALRQWSFKRPWKKIWLIMNSDETTQDIDHKVRECQALLNSDVYGSQLLGVHPILLRQVREKTNECIIGGSESCTGAWQKGNTVVETWCGHISCFACLHHYWLTHQWDIDIGDVPNPVAAGDWPCVMCRRSPGRLRSKLEIAQTDLVGPEGDVAADENILDLTHEPLSH